MDHTRPPLFQCLELDQGVTVTLRVHVLGGCLSVTMNICCHRLSHCGLDWDCMLLEWIGVHSPRFVCDCDIESSRACYRSCSEWVSCRGCRSCQSVHNIPKLTIPLPLCFESQSLKPASADTPSRFTPLPLFSSSSSGLLVISCFLSSSTYLSHTLRTGELKQWQLKQTLRLCGPLHSQKRLRNLLQHDRKIFKPSFIVTRSVSPMLSGMLAMKTQWMTPLMNESTIIKVLPPYKYSNCSLSS